MHTKQITRDHSQTAVQPFFSSIGIFSGRAHLQLCSSSSWPTMSGSSLANWDGSQSASNPKQSFNDDVRTSSFGVRLASTTSTETIKYDRTGAHLDASLTSMEDHHTVWRVGESNQNVSSMARVFFFFLWLMLPCLAP